MINNLTNKIKALVVVAHPDDHFIWMGGTIYMLKNDWEWHILYLCDYPDSEKRKKSEESFKVSCEKLGIKIYNDASQSSRDIKDMELQQSEKMYQELEIFWNKNTNDKKENYDIIFTHSLNPHNEYSFHPNHAEVREMLYRFLGHISSYEYRPVIAHFCYNPRSGGQEVDEKEATHTVSLDKDSHELKKRENFLKIFPWAEGDMNGFKIPEEKEGFKLLFLDSYLVGDKKEFYLSSVFNVLTT